MTDRGKRIVLGYWRTALVSVLILILTLRRMPPVPSDFIFYKIPHFDKIVHFFMFMTLAMAAAHDFVFSKKESKLNIKALLLYVVALPTVYGGIIELLQQYCTASRSGDWFDLAADFSGTVVCAIIASVYYRRTHNGK